MQKQQPLILAYLMAVDHDILNQEERELLLYIGIVVWQIMLHGDKPLLEITEKILNEVEDKNMKMMKYLEGESEMGFMENLDRLVSNYNQKEVLEYVIEALMKGLEEESTVRDENTGIMMLSLKTVIDCFDR